jgi:hypothetical protein
MLSYRQWLKENAGPVFATDTANTAVDDGFKKLRSKYMADNVPQREREADPDKVFGKRKRKMKPK